MTDQNKIDIVIDGRNLTVVGGENEEYVRALAYYVDNKIRDLSSKNSRLSQIMSATLAALNIADELYKTKDELEKLQNKAKDPLEKYESINIELEEARERIQDLRAKTKKMETTLSNKEIEKENLLGNIRNLKKELQLKEEALNESNKHNKILQDKNFKNQVELVEAKKELIEYTRLLSNQTSTVSNGKENKYSEE